MEAPSAGRLPSWIKVRPPSGARYAAVRDRVATLQLGTVCREARCPNLPECWSEGTATLMLLGTDCTRRCGFCAVNTHWPRGTVDASEPERVARAVGEWRLRYVVLTQVCRDDLPDGGARHMADTVRAIRERSPGTLVELLVGDLGGDESALRTVLAENPDVLAHNVETVPRLSEKARDRRASYPQSVQLLASAARHRGGGQVTKTSLMLGLGETADELGQTFQELRAAGVGLLTLGQYLRPTPEHLPVHRYVPPAEFDELKSRALAAGFAGVEAGPLVRSSYRAQDLFERATRRRGD